MSVILAQIAPFTSVWTAQSQYILDFERGLVTHSKTLTKGQFNRYLCEPFKALQRRDLNSRQSYQYFQQYITAQRFMLFLKQANYNEIEKLCFQATRSYAMNHKGLWEKIDSQLIYPMVQRAYGGFVRTGIERDNLINYVKKISDRATDYGMKFWQGMFREEESAKAYSVLRDIAFKPRAKVQTAESEQ